MVNISEEQRNAVLEAVRSLQRNPYGTTAIKVEFEADLDRDGCSGEEDGDGNWQDGFADEEACEEYLVDALERKGINRGTGLTFAHFYNDGSVDSEFTFTLKLNEPADALKLVTVMECWNEFCQAVKEQGGKACDVRGAGMHMALLNSANGEYPATMLDADEARFFNFKKSVTMLLPALYFLATPNNISRGLEYRRPEIGIGGERHGYTKCNAVVYKDGAIEFRVFDTCYQKPEQILDNVCVIANCMKFWQDQYVDPDVKIKQLNFGVDNSRELERFYQSIPHIDVLNYGLQILRPKYKTVGQLKAERNFKLTKNRFRGQETKWRRDAEKSYGEYKERVFWRAEIWKADAYASYLMRPGTTAPPEEREAARVRAAQEAERVYQHEIKELLSPVDYIQSQIRDLRNRSQGNYTLAV